MYPGPAAVAGYVQSMAMLVPHATPSSATVAVRGVSTAAASVTVVGEVGGPVSAAGMPMASVIAAAAPAAAKTILFRTVRRRRSSRALIRSTRSTGGATA